jgi:pSer/pThr/pTyr-binding forkhead associated (FHA) protein
MTRLILTSPDPLRDKIVLEGLPATIGRDDSADVCVEDPWVSRFHCILTDDDERPRVLDLGTASGTFVNGERIRAADLLLGDTLTVGRSTFVVYFEPKPESIRRAPLLTVML